MALGYPHKKPDGGTLAAPSQPRVLYCCVTIGAEAPLLVKLKFDVQFILPIGDRCDIHGAGFVAVLEE